MDDALTTDGRSAIREPVRPAISSAPRSESVETDDGLLARGMTGLALSRGG